MKVLITTPNYDNATSYLFHYAKEIINFAVDRGIFIVQLARPRLRRNQVEEIIIKQNPLLLLFNAHGDSRTIYGDKIGEDEEFLIKEGKNHQLLKGKLTYARACWAAASLGKTCTEKEGCFIGYKKPFSFWIDKKWSANPLKDKTAKLFLSPSNTIIFSLLKGRTAEESVNNSFNQSKKNILQLLKKEKEPGAMASATVLWSNIESQVILGNKKMKLE